MLRHESTSSQGACEQEDRSCVDVAYRVLQLALELGLGVLGLDHRHAGDEDAAVVDDGELPGPVLGLGLACDELAVRDVGRLHGEGHAQGWRPGGQAEHLSKRIVSPWGATAAASRRSAGKTTFAGDAVVDLEPGEAAGRQSSASRATAQACVADA